MVQRKKLMDLLIRTMLWIASFLTLFFLLWLLVDLVMKGISGIRPDFLLGEYNEYKGQHGIAPMLVTTCWMIGLTLMIAMPAGVFSAIYLVEYSKPGLTVNLIRYATENLAGIPSIIYGLFGYILFKNVLGLGFSILSGALTLSVMVLPSIMRTTEEALKSVDTRYRESSLALGATRLYTLCHIILPCAGPQILSAVLLCTGRIIGETAAVYFTAGTVYRFPKGLLHSGRTLSVHLFMLARETGNFDEAYSCALLLVFLVGLLHLAVNHVAKHMGAKRENRG